ncbi:uncharacterized protein YwqG [Paenibacillus phyllosphaerae]|uniref:Uncharacterized protein YwqG n=1 Tax=Paenibacillus phyllosphaerae TaxID=274593 RepID=A0A7W5B1B4_9BACL|nr:YwqG family protein [Paenibacillus phyllosphaerae]MBB3112299.1 uncharacterized protein YwqG [Paenibacillus phyllosphaerae]
MNQRERIVELITDSGLDRVKQSLIELLADSVRLNSEPCPDDEIGIGSSKLGGCPDLPVGVEWPTYGGRPLNLIAQLNLADVQPYEPAQRLPREGFLSFFYDALEQPWGFDPQDKGRFKVIYSEPGLQLQRLPEPEELSEQGNFGAMRLSSQLDTTFPSIDTIEVVQLDLNVDEDELYWELTDQIAGSKDETLIHRMFGHPDTIQNAMQLECQLVTNGIYCGTSDGYDDARAAELAPGSSDWKLLLQVDSEEGIGTIWGIDGRLYFWIREQDLAARNFDHVWVIQQCT